MTCKDCVHYERCKWNADTLRDAGLLVDFTDDDELASERCIFFKNKANFVELPCKVRDTVYCVDTILKTTEKYKVYGVGFFKDERIKLYVDDGECEYVTDNWYNTKEEAEQKLKGGADNGKVY